MDNDERIISRGMIYGYELDRHVWRATERAALWGALAGAIMTNVFWLIALSW